MNVALSISTILLTNWFDAVQQIVIKKSRILFKHNIVNLFVYNNQ